MKTKLVIFDAYGVTLLGGFPETMQALAKRFKRNWKDLYAVFYTKYFNMAATRKMTQADAWEKGAKETGLHINGKQVRDIHYRFIRFNPPMVNFIKNKSKKTTTLLLSKNTRSQMYDTDKKLGYKKLFHTVINTWEINLAKASKKTMRYIFKKFNVKPAEVIYIDDQDSNLEAARELGVHTILYKNFSQFKKDFNKVYKT